MIGKFIQQPGGYRAFVPNAFPPSGLTISPQVMLVNEAASLALGRLDGLAELVPDIKFFTFMYAAKEASLSNNIEGTKATMSDYVHAQAGITHNLPDDVANIACYIKALNQGLAQLDRLPLASRLIKEIHSQLIPETERQGVSAGQFRTSPNWIGGTRPGNADFVPPPPSEVNRCMKDWDNFINRNKSYPILIKVALGHAQFETIHPFLDGNGRLGRLLITLQLCQAKVLSQPILYISNYLKRHRRTYFDRLTDYRGENLVDDWLRFFLEGIEVTAQEATLITRKLVKLQEYDQGLITQLPGRQAHSAQKLLKGLYQLPTMDISQIMDHTGLSRPAAYGLANRLNSLGIFSKRYKHMTSQRGIYYVYDKYLQIFEVDD